MKAYLLAAIPILAAPLLVAACGADSDATRPRQPTVYPTNTRDGVGPDSNQIGPPPQNMPGGGRGSEPPHFKGKP